MLTHPQLIALADSLRDERILSVYLDGTEENPATQWAWRTRLDHALQELRAWLADSSTAERELFERCVALLDEQLPRPPRTVGAPGWVAFVNANGVRHTERLPVRVPTLAVWSTGICVAPYTRALKETRPVVLALADARKAVIYQYGEGTLHKHETVRAHVTVEPPTHMGDIPRAGFHTGTRGTTGRDEAQRELLVGTAHMLAEVADHVLRLAAPDAWMLTGGIPHVAKHLAQLLMQSPTHSAPARVLALESLDVHASDAAIAAAAREGATALRDADDRRRVTAIIDQAGGRGLAALGPAATRHALGQARVRELYFTNHYLQDHLVEAEDAVRATLAQGGTAEEVSHDVAQILDVHGGMAARLRYRLSGEESL